MNRYSLLCSRRVLLNYRHLTFTSAHCRSGDTRYSNSADAMRYRTAAGLGERISDLGIWIRAWTAGLCRVLRSKVAAWPSMWESNERSLLSPPHKKRPVSLDKEWTSSSFLHRDTSSVDCSKHCCTDDNGRRCHWQTLLQTFFGSVRCRISVKFIL